MASGNVTNIVILFVIIVFCCIFLVFLGHELFSSDALEVPYEPIPDSKLTFMRSKYNKHLYGVGTYFTPPPPPQESSTPSSPSSSPASTCMQQVQPSFVNATQAENIVRGAKPSSSVVNPCAPSSVKNGVLYLYSEYNFSGSILGELKPGEAKMLNRHGTVKSAQYLIDDKIVDDVLIYVTFGTQPNVAKTEDFHTQLNGINPQPSLTYGPDPNPDFLWCHFVAVTCMHEEMGRLSLTGAKIYTNLDNKGIKSGPFLTFGSTYASVPLGSTLVYDILKYKPNIKNPVIIGSGANLGGLTGYSKNPEIRDGQLFIYSDGATAGYGTSDVNVDEHGPYYVAIYDRDTQKDAMYFFIHYSDGPQPIEAPTNGVEYATV